MIKPWKVLASTRLRKNLRIDTCELPNGRIIEPLILEFRDWVTIVALTRQQEILLIKQYRHGAQKVLWEFPGGGMEEGESPLEAAKRELLEETGYSSQNFIETGCVSPDPADHTNMMHAFLALDVEKVALQALDETEEIEVFPIPFNTVLKMAQNGELLQSLHISALFFALFHLNRVAP